MNHTLKDYALALQLLGATADVSGEMVVAKKGRKQVCFWISDKYGLFGADQDGETLYSLHQIRQALGLTENLRPSVLLARALRTIGLNNRGAFKTFKVHGEYNTAKERVRTIADFYGKDTEVTVVRRWDEVKAPLHMVGCPFELREYAGVFHYVSN